MPQSTVPGVAHHIAQTSTPLKTFFHSFYLSTLVERCHEHLRQWGKLHLSVFKVFHEDPNGYLKLLYKMQVFYNLGMRPECFAQRLVCKLIFLYSIHVF